MDPAITIYMERAENELVLSRTLFRLSSNDSMKNRLKIQHRFSFYSAVITHAYYSIFYCAKAYLFSKGIKTKIPSVHTKTYHEFSRFVQSGVLNKELLEIYNDARVKAEALLDILFKERKKRGFFTYQKLPQSNLTPASESLKNAEKFFKSIYNLLE